MPDQQRRHDPCLKKFLTGAPITRPLFTHPWHDSFKGITTSQLQFKEDLPDVFPLEIVPATMQAAVKKRKAEFLAGQLCAQASLERAGFTPTMPARNPDRSPLWPEGSTGSISHSRDQAIAIIGPTKIWKSLGVDIEHRAAQDLATLLCRDVMGPAEERVVTAFFGSMSFERVFSVKEAAFKAIYPLTRKMFEFRDIEIVAMQGDGRMTLQLLHDLGRSWRAGSTITAYQTVIDDIVLSVSGVPAEP